MAFIFVSIAPYPFQFSHRLHLCLELYKLTRATDKEEVFSIPIRIPGCVAAFWAMTAETICKQLPFYHLTTI